MAIGLTLVGAPSSAGAHHAGQDRAPDALRRAHLAERLVAAGFEVHDAGDIAGEVWAPDGLNVQVRNIEAVVRVADAVASAVQQQSAAGRVLVVMGGDCTITVGVVAGLQRVHDEVRIAYLDGDADLSSPDRTRSGVLDATGVAHLLGIADTPLARIGRQFPMLDPHQLTLLGYDPTDPDSFDEQALRDRPDLVHASDADLRADPTGVARRAISAIDTQGAAVVVHFDVDAVDSRDLALANFPHYGTGVSLETAGQALEILFGAAGLAAIVLTEINPSHDPTGALLDRYIDAFVRATAGMHAPERSFTGPGAAAAVG